MGLHVAVMAGGRGERFWPLSRADHPKQFLRLGGQFSFLQQALRRAAQLQPDAIWLVTGERYRALAEAQARELGIAVRILVEPVARDTAACVGLAAVAARHEDPSAVLLMLPADHAIRDETAFAAAARMALTEAAARPQALITFGIRPNRAETGYGYLRAVAAADGATLRRVERFLEKPDLETARALIAEPNTYWNSGMFAWRASAILSAIAQHLPALAASLDTLAKAWGTSERDSVLAKVFAELPKLSIDYAVMEKAQDVFVLPTDCAWDDIGDWQALTRFLPGDAADNVRVGKAALVDTRSSVVVVEGERPVITFGLEDTVVVAAQDVVVVAAKTRAAHWKELVSQLQPDSGLAKLLESDQSVATLLPPPRAARLVAKPWGHEMWWAETEQYLGKLLFVKAGQSLSLQYHEHKLETLYFVGGRGHLELEGAELTAQPGLVQTVRPGQRHRIRAETDMLVLEVSTAHPDDVVRVEDRYGRTSLKHRQEAL